MTARPPEIRALFDEIIVDNFAGGGGTSEGIYQALGRHVDIAINHDPEAIAMHKANHPETEHFPEDVFDINPVEVCNGRPVGVAWFSPDCTHHSKAKGGKPVDKKIRGLAWIAVRWAAAVRPRIIFLENVEEFQKWGPLKKDNKPCPINQARTFRAFKKVLTTGLSLNHPDVEEIKEFLGNSITDEIIEKGLGYKLEYRELRACDYGAPTIRKRLFMIARCDGQPIVWPKPTHGPGLLSYRTAAECVDWSIPCPSIFTRRKPLAENTMKRIAKGIKRFILDTEHPYIVDNNILPFMTEHANASSQRVFSIDEPMRTQCAQVKGGHFALVSAFMAQHNTGVVGRHAQNPLSTITSRGTQQQIVAAHLINLKGSARRHQDLRNPAPTVCSGGTHVSLVAALMAPYYSSGSGTTGRDLRIPSPTVTTKGRLQLITVEIDGTNYVLTDIGMRMFQPRELYTAQGFRPTYKIAIKIKDRFGREKLLGKTAQIRMCGNSVPPPFAKALIEANYLTQSNTEQVSA